MMTAGANTLGDAGRDRPTALVIMGASGNLTHQKLGPALFNLYRKGRLPRHVHIVGIARNEMTDEEFRNRIRDGCGAQASGPDWDQFASLLSYSTTDVTDAGALSGAGQRIGHLSRMETWA